MTRADSPTSQEVEIKVRVSNRAALEAKLPALGFALQTPETMERNTLFDTPGGDLRQRRQLLRIRQYGERWILTHKAQPENVAETGHKIRLETETEVADGRALAAVFGRLGYLPTFLYEKLRTEWTDGQGHVVLDVTPIGTYAELEGEPDWIDRTAARLGISSEQYMTTSYGQLFLEWKRTTQHPAMNMTFEEIQPEARAESCP